MQGSVPVVLILTDADPATDSVLAAVRARAARGPARFRLLVTNPLPHETHLRHPLHPERHDGVAATAARLSDWTAAIESIVGAEVVGDVSIRHDPHEALEELMVVHPVDEVIFSVARHRLSERVHVDLGRRLARHGLIAIDARPEPETGDGA